MIGIKYLVGVAEAARYLGLDEDVLKRALREKTGPAYLRPSKRKRLFLREDLDKWRDGWRRVDPNPI